MHFTTDRLTIRPFIEDDIHDVYTIYQEEETCRYLLHGPWTTEDREERFRKKLLNQSLSSESGLSLAVLEGDRIIGDLSVWYTGMKDTVEIGYSFARETGGKGYATEALRGLVKRLFIEYDIHRIQATLDSRNQASAKLCERIGMRKEAHFMQDYWNKGEWTDSLVYGMLMADLDPEM
ncbi:GNAT family N-acetyltransferase [Rossellomorea marisflavi]|uniref:GNAT family N-acetyltransferase n=1 Tax=Rossellomorea marisflavi TaxID=189381 RepID=UPI00345A0472